MSNIDKALADAVKHILLTGQSNTIDGMTRTYAPLRDIYKVMQGERKARVRRSRRPLFCAVDLSGVQ